MTIEKNKNTPLFYPYPHIKIDIILMLNYYPPMGFLSDKKFKIRQAFAKAGICVATALNITNAFNINSLAAVIALPFSLISLSVLTYLQNREWDQECERQSGPVPRAAFEITQKLSAKIGIPTPAVYLSSIFSIYKDKTLTVRMLACKDELSGAISHEIAHAKNKDHWHRQMQKLACKFNQHSLITQTLCAITYSLMTTDYASLKIFPFSIAAYGAAYLLSSYHGRQEEFEADKGSAQLLGSGIPLAKYLWRVSLIEDNPAGVHKIYNRLTATHPPSDIRIKELIEKEGGWGEHRPRPTTAI